LYPLLGGFFEECHKKGMTTFLVTNGTCPQALANLDPLPTQLYLSLDAPTEKIYKKLCVPLIPKAWEKINETLTLLPSLSTRTVIRHTLVNDWNIGWEKEYAKLDSMADPLFIEPKGYVFVGYSRQRMHIEHMPSHEVVTDFGKKLSTLLGYTIAQERKESRVLLLTRDTKKMRLPC
jgi:tRNA wybutosine-synthesizing protein 1